MIKWIDPWILRTFSCGCNGDDFMLTVFLLVSCAALFVFTSVYTYESLREKEPRSPKFGVCGVLLSLAVAGSIYLFPWLRIPFAVLLGLVWVFALICLVPSFQGIRTTRGTLEDVVADVSRFDERDIVFARFRLGNEGSKSKIACYEKYYRELHPEREDADERRRAKGMLGRYGAIDDGYPPHVSMTLSSFDMPVYLEPHAVSRPDKHIDPVDMDAAFSTHIVKNQARHLGADLVGICRVNPFWIYSRRGEIHLDNWHEWGAELTDIPPFAVVMCTEMNWEHISAAPHTPVVAETAKNYAKGAYLSTLLARWFARLGYRGVAQNTRHYDTLLPPLAVDAGLGEVGRNGYLIAPRYGARVRVFATLTDMPLIPDKPISIGVHEFCRRCKKCGKACPSRSIPLNEKVVFNGVRKWKMDEESCFEYWSKAGTDCSVCMAVCPFSRPDTFSHKIVRRIVSRSPVARTIFPYMDNLIYGRKWKTRKVSSWLDYSKRFNMTKKTGDRKNDDG